MTQRWDVFVSYAHEDEQWVQVLADNLHRVGLEVFLDQWEVVGGSRLSQRLQQGLASADVVVSAAAVGKPCWQEEFAGAMAGVVAGVQRLVPVLVDEVPLPPFVAGRVYVDFRYVDALAGYEARFAELVRAVRGLPVGDRPERGEGIVVMPPGVYRAEGRPVTRLSSHAATGHPATAARSLSLRSRTLSGRPCGTATAARPEGGTPRQMVPSVAKPWSHDRGKLLVAHTRSPCRRPANMLQPTMCRAVADDHTPAHGLPRASVLLPLAGPDP